MISRRLNIVLSDPNGIVVAEVTLPTVIRSDAQLSANDIHGWKVRVKLIDVEETPLTP